MLSRRDTEADVRRGFKTEAERTAAEYRAQIGCGNLDALDLDDLALVLEVELIPADDLVGLERLEELNEIQPGAFSAGTFSVANGRRVVVFNPLNSEGRQRSDLAHELAHIILGHKVRTIESVGELKLLTCDAEQEEEADWLAGCLLLPRPLLLKCARNGMSAEKVANKHRTSEQMARFRLNASGVLVQVGRAKAARSRKSG